MGQTIQRYIVINTGLSFMAELRLKIKRRAFPSEGRVRLNESVLTELSIQNGASVDLINSATNKSVSASVFTDSMVGKGQARVSEEDLKKIGLKDGDEVVVRVTPPLKEKVKKAADDTSGIVAKEAGKLGEKAKKTAGEVKAGAGKAYESASKATKKGFEKVKKKVREKDL
jgi:formylmethanofuran dehydrogenase subunit D